jgi:hypothetical protein
MRAAPWRAALMGLGVFLSSRVGEAQQWVVGTSAELASGLAGGGSDGVVMERARTRLRIGADLRVDEFPKDIFGVSVIAELEPRASFGIDLRYMRRISPRIDIGAGAVGLIFPESLVGPSCAMRVHFALSHALDLVVGPEVDVFVIGTDLPSDTVVWQALLQVGVHIDL